MTLLLTDVTVGDRHGWAVQVDGGTPRVGAEHPCLASVGPKQAELILARLADQLVIAATAAKLVAQCRPVQCVVEVRSE